MDERGLLQDAVERLAFIGAAKELGLSLGDIGELLPVWHAGTCPEVKAGLRPRVGPPSSGEPRPSPAR